MDFSLQTIIEAFTIMPLWEVVAVLLGIVYVILAAKESAVAWIFAFFNTLIYTILFWEGALISSSALNLYYMVMAVYGFILWRDNPNKEEKLEVTSWGFYKLFITLLLGVFLSVITGYLSALYLDAKFAYLDSTVMVFSVIATWMLAKKIIENWLVWMVVDSLAVILYWKSGYHTTTVLFVLYVVLAVYGFNSWRKALIAN